MSAPSSATEGAQPLFELPSNPVAYVAVFAALLTGVIHLVLAPQVVGFDPTTALLFALNGLGFLGGLVLFVSRYWRRELYLVAAVYALVTVVAYVVMSGPVNPLSIAAKAAELVLVLVSLYLYRATPKR
ncbi:hypothetical protein BV210_01325 [Halorientalis sp. IM1011]|uniref:DUF7475 family protein n=1 Tax=Halorientalis sp. IM1011 TaxID=1932360 RepID=UPI00097CD322|nr:hypothetical protein [Halorientalis sp. IM1011]AQL41437.1 hypothetical protein BV210_01325 [Halorientalis sp. IM1011]